MIIATAFFIKLDFNAKLRLITSEKLCLHAYSVLNVRKINKCMEILPWEQTL